MGPVVSRLPIDEIRQQTEARRLALLRMKLYRKNVFPCHCHTELRAVIGGRNCQVQIPGQGKIAMDKIEPFAICNSLPQRVSARLKDLVPPHVRNFQMIGPHDFRPEFSDISAKYVQSLSAPLFAPVKKHLQTNAYPEEWPLPCARKNSLSEAPPIQLPYAVWHRSLTWKNDAVSGDYLLRIGTDANFSARSDMFQRLRNRAKVAHAIVNDGYFHH